MALIAIGEHCALDVVLDGPKLLELRRDESCGDDVWEEGGDGVGVGG